MEIEKVVLELIKQPLKEIDIIVDSISYFKENNHMFLRIVIDKNPVVDINTCVLATNIINPLLDDNLTIEESYILDITSKERKEEDA